MEITNYKVYDLEESVVASRLPMIAEYDAIKFAGDVMIVAFEKHSPTLMETMAMGRACKLAANPPGSGHNNFLSGILVSANVTATNAWWMQFERYHFAQIVSSQSKMHRLRKMITEGKGYPFNKKTDVDSVSVLLYAAGRSVDDETLVYSCPMGLELTARITTNYLQLKTIYGQRKDHKLQEWRDFCGWIESLPFAKEFITGETKGN